MRIEDILSAGFLEGDLRSVALESTEPPGGAEKANGGDLEPVWQESTTPSGIQVRFGFNPKREYQIRDWVPMHPDEEWQTVPSVTEILDCLNKAGLPWWGMKVGVEGTLRLFERRVIYGIGTAMTDAAGGEINADDIVRFLTQEKLTVNHVRDTAGDRGTVVHDALEMWAATGFVPNPDDYLEEQRGYIRALVRFLDESKIVPHRSEVMVGSLEHGYAGRFDLHAYSAGNEVVTYLTEKNEKRSIIEPGLGLFDLKTSSGVYKTHAIQLEAYEKAAQECGYEATDFRAVVHCCRDGRYQVRVSQAAFDDFLAVKGAYHAMQGKLI